MIDRHYHLSDNGNLYLWALKMLPSSSNLMFDYFAPIFIRAIFYSHHFLFAPFFIPNLLNSHLTKVKESRTPIYGYLHSLGAKNGSIIITSNLMSETISPNFIHANFSQLNLSPTCRVSRHKCQFWRRHPIDSDILLCLTCHTLSV
jgi:hypothetical protein